MGLPFLTTIGCFLEVILWLMIAGTILFLAFALLYDFLERRRQRLRNMKNQIELEDDERAKQFLEDCERRI